MTTPTVSLPGSMTLARLKELAAAEGPCVTLVIPHAGGDAFRIKMKDGLRHVDERARGLAAAVRATLEGADIDSAQPGTFVLLQCAVSGECFETPEKLAEEIAIGPHFAIRALLPLLSRPQEFLLLALSQNRARLLHCTATTSEEVAFPAGVPTSLADAMQTRPPDHMLDNKSAGGPSNGAMRGVMFGTGTEREDKSERLLQFFSALNRGLHPLFTDGISVVPVGVEHELALYRTVNTYPHLVEPGVHGAPDGLKGGEMHRRALELLNTRLPEPVRKTLEHFDKLVGTGHASVHTREIVKAAFEGRVASLFLQPDAEYRGEFNEARQRVTHAADRTADLLNTAVVQTIANGGFAAVLPASAMPQGVPVCATFRYPL